MKSKIIHYLKETILFIIVMTVLANLISFYKSQDLNLNPFKVATLQLIESKNYTIDNKKPLLIHFWATWCPTCAIEAANIEKVAQDYQVVTIAVKSGSDDAIKSYLRQNKLSFNVVNDKDGSLSKEFNIAAFPTTFIYDRNKNLLFSDVGYTSTLGLYSRMMWAEF